jgi:hypothetical protein
MFVKNVWETAVCLLPQVKGYSVEHNRYGKKWKFMNEWNDSEGSGSVPLLALILAPHRLQIS